MEIEITVGNHTETIEVQDPFRADTHMVEQKVRALAGTERIDGLDIEGLVRRMIKGVYGCEEGCPADAKSLVRSGYGPFKLAYIEGGILTAAYSLPDGTPLEIKVFPEF